MGVGHTGRQLKAIRSSPLHCVQGWGRLQTATVYAMQLLAVHAMTEAHVTTWIVIRSSLDLNPHCMKGWGQLHH